MNANLGVTMENAKFAVGFGLIAAV